MKSLLKHMSIYGIGGILSRSISFLLLPLYTHVLTPEDYGILTLVSMVSGVMAILYGLMITSGFTRSYYDCSSEEQKNQLFGSAFWFTLFNAGIFSTIAVVFSGSITRVIFNFQDSNLYFRLVLFSTVLMSCNTVFYGLLRVNQKSRTYVTINIITLVSTLSVTIFTLLVLKWAIKGVLIGQIFGLSTEFIVLAILQLRKRYLAFSWASVIEMLKFSLPLIPQQLTHFVLVFSDRFFLQGYRNLDEVGLYSVGYKIASILPIIIITPLKAWAPYIFSFAHNPAKAKRTIADFSRYYLAGALCITLLISFFSEEVLGLIAHKDFHSSWKVVYLLSISYVLYGTMEVVYSGFAIVKNTILPSTLYILAAIINLFLNYIFIPRWGMIGASVATTISFSLILVGYFLLLSKVYPIAFEYRNFVFALVISCLLYYLSTLITYRALSSIAIKTSLLLLFPAILTLSGYFSPQDIGKMKTLISLLKPKVLSRIGY